jgi:urocanate hydratase
MNGAAFLGIDVDKIRIQKRVATGYLDAMSDNLDDALRLVLKAKKDRKPLSVGLIGNAGEVLPLILNKGI